MDDDNDDTGNDNDSGNDSKPTGKQLRERMEAALAENATLKAQLMVHNAGLGHLSDAQRRAVVREASEGGKEVTADLLKAAAKDLGFPEATASITTTTNDDTGNNDTGGNDDQGTGGNTDTDPLNNMEAIERAQRAAVHNAGELAFADRLAKAGSKAEVEAIIRESGHSVGIVHEMDID